MRRSRVARGVAAALLAAAAFAAAASSVAAAPLARSGQYDQLTLVVAGDAVTGTFVDARGQDGPGGAPQFSCIFLLRGTLKGDRAKVETWYPGDAEHIAGELVFTAEGATLKLVEDQGGCPMTSGSMVKEPYRLSREEAVDAAGWTGVALVKAKKTTFWDSPGATVPFAPYVIEADPLVILKRQNDWYRVTYRAGRKPVTGWLPASDIAVP